MRLGKYLSELTKPELNEIQELLNLTDDEEEVFLHLSKGRTKQRISMECLISIGTVSNRIKSIETKLKRL